MVCRWRPNRDYVKEIAAFKEDFKILTRHEKRTNSKYVPIYIPGFFTEEEIAKENDKKSNKGSKKAAKENVKKATKGTKKVAKPRVKKAIKGIRVRRPRSPRRPKRLFIPDVWNLITFKMPNYWAHTCCQSDGQEVLENGNVANGPANTTPIADANGAVNFFRKLVDTPGANHGRLGQWKVKLGMFMKAQFDPENATDHAWFLNELPLGFTLWENVHYTAAPAVDETGAVIPGQFQTDGEGHPVPLTETIRSDCYLYGYPFAGKKRYRSPREFYPHLAWLCTVLTCDRSLCECQHCTAVVRRAGNSYVPPVAEDGYVQSWDTAFDAAHFHPGFYDAAAANGSTAQV